MRRSSLSVLFLRRSRFLFLLRSRFRIPPFRGSRHCFALHLAYLLLRLSRDLQNLLALRGASRGRGCVEVKERESATNVDGENEKGARNVNFAKRRNPRGDRRDNTGVRRTCSRGSLGHGVFTSRYDGVTTSLFGYRDAPRVCPEVIPLHGNSFPFSTLPRCFSESSSSVGHRSKC